MPFHPAPSKVERTAPKKSADEEFRNDTELRKTLPLFEGYEVAPDLEADFYSVPYQRNIIGLIINQTSPI